MDGQQGMKTNLTAQKLSLVTLATHWAIIRQHLAVGQMVLGVFQGLCVKVGQ